MAMFCGSPSDKIRLEQRILAEEQKYRDAGDTTSMTDWELHLNRPIVAKNVDNAKYYRRRLNNDGTYEVMCIKKDYIVEKRPPFNSIPTGLFYVKLMTLNVNEESPSKHRDALIDGRSIFEKKSRIDYRDWFHVESGEDIGGEYLCDLLLCYPDNRFEGKNHKGEIVTEYKDCICNEEELRAFTSAVGIDIDFTVPEYLCHHFDPEHNHEY